MTNLVILYTYTEQDTEAVLKSKNFLERDEKVLGYCRESRWEMNMLLVRLQNKKCLFIENYLYLYILKMADAYKIWFGINWLHYY